MTTPSSLTTCRGPRVPAARGRREGDGNGELWGRSFCLADLAAAYSSAPWGAVPWALRGFTAEFGMGSGGTPAPLGHQVGQAEGSVNADSMGCPLAQGC